MAPTIPSSEPRLLRQGDTWAWTISIDDFPASDGWKLSYNLRGPADVAIAWGTHVTADGDAFAVTVPIATTATATAGTYKFFRVLTKSDDSERYAKLLDRSFRMLADPSTAVAAASATKSLLDAIDARLAAKALTAEQSALSINGRSIAFYSLEELRAMRSEVALRYELERNPNGRLRRATRFI